VVPEATAHSPASAGMRCANPARNDTAGDPPRDRGDHPLAPQPVAGDAPVTGLLTAYPDRNVTNPDWTAARSAQDRAADASEMLTDTCRGVFMQPGRWIFI
jgi:hypothetical protein